MSNDRDLKMHDADMPIDDQRLPERRYDLEERTARFGEAIIGFAKRIPINPITEPLIKQLIRAGTSVGANYCEADDSSTKKEFRYRVSICKREARETKHWLRMIAAAIPSKNDAAKPHWREARELHLIFVSIYRRTPSGSVKRPK